MTVAARETGEEWSQASFWISAPAHDSAPEVARLFSNALGTAAALPQRVDLHLSRFASGWWCGRLYSIDQPAWRPELSSLSEGWKIQVRYPQQQWRLTDLSSGRVEGELPPGALFHPEPEVQAEVTRRLSTFIGQPLSRPEAYFEWMERWGEDASWEEMTLVFDGRLLSSPAPPAQFGFHSTRRAQRAEKLETNARTILAGSSIVAAALLFPCYVYFHTFRPPAEEAGTTVVIIGLLACFAALESLVTWEFRPTRWWVRLVVFQAGNAIAVAVGALLSLVAR